MPENHNKPQQLNILKYSHKNGDNRAACAARGKISHKVRNVE